MTLHVRRGRDRPVTDGPGTRTRHSFSFGRHYDPDQVGFGPLVALNDERLEPGAGYPEHPHAGVDLVTWVVAGELRHEDSTGVVAALRPGTVQVLRTGTGVLHAERAGPGAEVRFLQLWLVAEPGVPGCQRRDVSAELDAGGLVVLASGDRREGNLELGEPGVVVRAGRLREGETVVLPGAPLVHVHVVSGTVVLPGVEDELHEGDEVRAHAAGPLRLLTRAPAEVLVTIAGESP